MTTAFTSSLSIFAISMLFAATLTIARREYALESHVRVWAISFGLLAASHAFRLPVLDAPASGGVAAYMARAAFISSAVSLAYGFRARIRRRSRGIVGAGAVALTLLLSCWAHGGPIALLSARVLTAATTTAMTVMIFRALRGVGVTALVMKSVAMCYGIYMTLITFAAFSVWVDGGITESVFAALIRVGMPVATVTTGILVLIVLVSDLASALREQALLDPLTQLLNRRGLNERLRNVASSGRHVMIATDLDSFKAINDRHGHATGDRVLVAFAEHLRETASDFHIARVGGEEFLLVATGISLDEAQRRAEAICRGVSHSVGRAAGLLNVTASFGIAEGFPDENVESVTEKVDVALYEAKGAGRDRVVVFDPSWASRRSALPGA